MPIINQVVAGSGGASVQQPYVKYVIDANGNITADSSVPINFDGVKSITKDYQFYGLYADDSNVTGAIIFNDLEKVAGKNSLATLFKSTNITGCDFKKLVYMLEVNQPYTGPFYYFCAWCPNLTYLYANELTDIAQHTCQYICYGCSSLATVSMNSLLRIHQGGLSYGFYNCTSLTSAPVGKLVRVDYNGLQYAFKSTAITSLSFNNLAYTTNTSGTKNGSFDNMLSGCSNVTVHFPADWETTMQGWSDVTNGFGGTNTTVLFDLPSVTTLDWSNIKNLGGLSDILRNCSGVTSIDVSSVESEYNLYCAFLGTGISTMEWKSLKKFGENQALYYAYSGCTSLRSLWFYAIDTDSFDTTVEYSFKNMLNNCTDVVVHAPMRVQSIANSKYFTASNFGGTNTTVLFDLVTSLTGADSNTYTRSEKNSTSTATAWDNGGTLYYTSGVSNHTNGVNEPSVGDTIYSDAACQTAVTTISSIA